MEEEVNLEDDVMLEDDETEVVESTEEVEEVVEEPTEEKKFSQAELDEILERRISRIKREHERENAKKEQLIKTVQAGVGEEDVSKLTNTLKDFYRESGVEVPEFINERDEKILAKADADEIIESGYSEMEEMANRIASKPSEQRTLREKVIFDVLCESMIEQKSIEELKKNGIETDILDNKDFKEFRKKFAPSTSIMEVHELYSKSKTVVERPKSTGSVKSTVVDTGIKEFYTPEEAKKLTREDYMNPKIREAVENSMTKWKR